MRVLVKSVNWRESKQHACVLLEMIEQKWKKLCQKKEVTEDSAYVRFRKVFYS